MGFFLYALPPSSWNGSIDSIRISWSADAPSRIRAYAERLGVPALTVKGMSEHFAHSTARRIGSDHIIIQGSPSLSSETAELSQDDSYITANATSGDASEHKVFIYLTGVGKGPGAYDNVRASGETVLKRNKIGYSLDQRKSYGSVGSQVVL